MAVIMRESTFAPIEESKLHGSFADFRKGKTVSVGAKPALDTKGNPFTSRWATVVDEEGLSQSFSFSKAVSATFEASVAGVTDSKLREAIALKLIDECSIIETDNLREDGTPYYTLGRRSGESRLRSEGQVNAAIEQVKGYSLKTAMRFAV